MTTPLSGRASGGEATQGASPREPDHETHQSTEAFDELNKLIGEVRTLGNRILNDFAALAQAQWRLTSYIVAGSARIWGMRVAAFVLIAILGVASWILLNVTIWQVARELTSAPFVPPLVLFLVNAGTAGILFLWQKGLRLQ